MQLTVNDKQQEMADGSHLALLLRKMDLTERRGLAVAVNATLVPAASWGQHRLHDGDTILIIQAAQGG